MASASSFEIAFWLPLTKAVAIVPAGPGNACWMWRSSWSRSPSRPDGGAGRRTVIGPSALPTAPSPLNQASRAKSWLPGSALGGGGASRARRRSSAPSLSPGGAASRSTLTRTCGGSFGSCGASVRRSLPSAARGSASSSVALNCAIAGRSSRGAVTHSAFSHANPSPAATVSPSQPSAVPLRPGTSRKPASIALAARHRSACHCTGPCKQNHSAMPPPNPAAPHRGSWSCCASRNSSIF